MIIILTRLYLQAREYTILDLISTLSHSTGNRILALPQTPPHRELKVSKLINSKVPTLWSMSNARVRAPVKLEVPENFDCDTADLKSLKFFSLA